MKRFQTCFILSFLILCCSSAKDFSLKTDVQKQKELFLKYALTSTVEKGDISSKGKLLLHKNFLIQSNKFDIGLPDKFISISLEPNELPKKILDKRISLISHSKTLAQDEYFQIENFVFDKLGEGTISISKLRRFNDSLISKTSDYKFEINEKNKWIIYTTRVDSISCSIIGFLRKKD